MRQGSSTDADRALPGLLPVRVMSLPVNSIVDRNDAHHGADDRESERTDNALDGGALNEHEHRPHHPTGKPHAGYPDPGFPDDRAQDASRLSILMHPRTLPVSAPSRRGDADARRASISGLTGPDRGRMLRRQVLTTRPAALPSEERELGGRDGPSPGGLSSGLGVRDCSACRTSCGCGPRTFWAMWVRRSLPWRWASQRFWSLTRRRLRWR